MKYVNEWKCRPLLWWRMLRKKCTFAAVMIKILMVALGGAAGSVARYWVSRLVQEHVCAGFPWPTLVVNVVGCLLIGFLYGLSGREAMGREELRLLLTTGFCGGFTTFSTFCNEGMGLLRSGQTLSSALYAGGSVVLGFVFVALGAWLASRC